MTGVGEMVLTVEYSWLTTMTDKSGQEIPAFVFPLPEVSAAVRARVEPFLSKLGDDGRVPECADFGVSVIGHRLTVMRKAEELLPELALWKPWVDFDSSLGSLPTSRTVLVGASDIFLASHWGRRGINPRDGARLKVAAKLLLLNYVRIKQAASE